MNWIKNNWGWVTVIIIGFLPLTGILSMINIDFSGTGSWISMDSITMHGRQPGDAPHEVSGVHLALKETGEWAIRWLVAILTLTPVAILTGKKASLYVRQAAGITAFVYAALHLLFFIIERGFMETFKEVSFILGLVSTVVMLVLAVTSSKRAIKYLRGAWKKLHRFAYLAGLLAVLHVALLKHGDWIPYLVILLIGFLLRLTFVKQFIQKLRPGKAKIEFAREA